MAGKLFFLYLQSMQSKNKRESIRHYHSNQNMREITAGVRKIRRDALALPDRRRAHPQAPYEDFHARKMLQQISELSSGYEEKKRKTILLASGLIIFSAICMILFMLDMNITTFFSMGAILILIQLLQCSYEFLEEGARTQRAYHAYLNGFSPHVLYHLRQTAPLSAWSRHEIDRYLKTMP
jgi:hypothetical protein